MLLSYLKLTHACAELDVPSNSDLISRVIEGNYFGTFNTFQPIITKKPARRPPIYFWCVGYWRLQTNKSFNLNLLIVLSMKEIATMVLLKSCITKPIPRKIEKEKEDSTGNDCRVMNKKSKGVFFAFVHVREHCRILGDHPSVSSGPPISLSWEIESDEMFSVDMYENVRYRRSKHEFLVPAAIRVSNISVK